jgi:hypothetical protein
MENSKSLCFDVIGIKGMFLDAGSWEGVLQPDVIMAPILQFFCWPSVGRCSAILDKGSRDLRPCLGQVKRTAALSGAPGP